MNEHNMEYFEQPHIAPACSNKEDTGLEKLDVSFKLLLINNAMKKLKKTFFNASLVSKQIFIDNNLYVSANECETIYGKYSFLLRKHVIFEVLLTVISIVFLFSLNHHWSPLQIFMGLLALPILFNFYREAILSSSLLFFNPKHLIPPVSNDIAQLKSVAIIIASRNEPFAVAKLTLDSAIALDYPLVKKEIIVVDNSDVSFPEYKSWKDYVESYGSDGERHIDETTIKFIHRDGVDGFKPKNLDIALTYVTAEFIMYLDIDSTLKKDTLLRAMPLLARDPSLGFLQLQTVPTNARNGSPLALAQSLRGYFLRFITNTNAYSSHNLFYGHNAIWRASVVREIGSCLEYYKNEIVVTEDISMSFRARFKGYHGASAWIESGEWVPESMRETETMWLRWTVGTYQVYAKHFSSLKQLNASELMGWLGHIGYLINSALVPLYILCALLLHSSFLMWISAVSFLPEFIVFMCAYLKLSLDRMKPLKKLSTCYLSFFVLTPFINWIKLIGLVRFLAGKKQGWVPTSKSQEKEISFIQIVANYYLFLLHGTGCVILSIYMLVFPAKNIVDHISLSLCLLYGVNTILSVYFFGKSRMPKKSDAAILDDHVDKFSSFYLG